MGRQIVVRRLTAELEVPGRRFRNGWKAGWMRAVVARTVELGTGSALK